MRAWAPVSFIPVPLRQLMRRGVSGDMKSPPLLRGAKARRRGWGGCALGDNYEGGEAIHQANSVDDRESIRKPVRGHRIHPITNFADG